MSAAQREREMNLNRVGDEREIASTEARTGTRAPLVRGDLRPDGPIGRERIPGADAPRPPLGGRVETCWRSALGQAQTSRTIHQPPGSSRLSLIRSCSDAPSGRWPISDSRTSRFSALLRRRFHFRMPRSTRSSQRWSSARCETSRAASRRCSGCCVRAAPFSSWNTSGRAGLYGRVQDLIRPVWSWFSAGCQPNRRTDEASPSRRLGRHDRRAPHVSLRPAAAAEARRIARRAAQSA